MPNTRITAVAHSAPFAAVTITSLGFQMIARAEKSRRMARALFQSGISSGDASQMPSALWNQLQAGLSRVGVLGRFSTPPSAATIARTIAELESLEVRSAVFAARVENRIAA